MPLYLEDLQPGQQWQSPPLTVTEEMIFSFAREHDPQPFHLDHTAADASLFGGLAASGWHTAALSMRLAVGSGLELANGHVGMGIDGIRWPKPVRPGDTLRVTVEVLAVTASRSQPGWGVMKARWTTHNQHGDVVAEILPNYWVQGRTAAGA